MCYIALFYVFEKDNIKFEIDDYSRPKMKIVAVEGEGQLVQEVCATFKDYKIKKSIL